MSTPPPSSLLGVKTLSIGAVRQRRRLDAIDYANSLVGVTRCAWCKWYWRGPFGKGREALKAHRQAKHS